MEKYDDRPVKWMIYPSLVFLMLGMTIGIFLAFNAFVFPDFFNTEYVTFGRLRPVHVGCVLWLWLLSAGVGLTYYFVPRLCGVRLWSIRLAAVATILWWSSLILGNFSIPFGTNWGWEYAELPMWLWGWFPVKAIFTLSWILVAINIFGTVARRIYPKMYVALWYTMATMLWTAFTFTAGNFGINLVPGGISRVNVNFFYMHNLVGLIFTPLGLAAAYYFIPKIAGVPLYSHRLSMIGFWTIAFFYAWVGAHHIIHGPMSQWLQTTSIVFSLWLFIPVWTVITNFFLTLRGHWEKYTQDVGIRFLMMGTVFYLLVCIQGPLQSFRNINEIISKTDWVIAHSHFSLYGTFSFFIFGALYYLIPRFAGRPWWSSRLGNWHFGLNMLGIFPFMLGLMIGGYFQGLEWADWANGSTYAQYQTNLAYVPFLQTVAGMWNWWLLRAIGGVIIWISNLLFILNIVNTLFLPRHEEIAA